MKQGEAHIACNPFPGVKALAKIVGCSPSTMSKAINRSSKLRAALVEHEKRRGAFAVTMTKRDIDSTEQTREAGPAEPVSTDDVFQHLLQQVTPSERANLNAMTASQRRELVATIQHDPDGGRYIRRRSR